MNISDCFRSLLNSFEIFGNLLEEIKNLHDYIMNLCDANMLDTCSIRYGNAFDMRSIQA